VFPLTAILQRRSGARRPSLAIPAVVSWAGTRGVVPLVHPLDLRQRAPLAQRDLVLVLAAAVIVVSLIVQGLTLEPLPRFAGITRPADARHEQTVARLRLAEAALARLDELADDDAAPDAVIDRARASLQARIGQTRARADGTWAPGPDGLTERELRRDLISAENAELARFYENGVVSAATRQRLQRNPDLETTRLSDDRHLNNRVLAQTVKLGAFLAASSGRSMLLVR
jgi:NhaP-type Na+/H+ or K+/H+ antiporter